MISSAQLLMEFQAAGALLAAAQLVRVGFAKRQPVMLTFMAATACTMLTLSFFPLETRGYYVGYYITQGILDPLLIVVVRELFSIIVNDYPGIRTAARWALNGAIVVSVVASSILTAVLWEFGARAGDHLYYTLVVHRSIQSSLAIVVISILFFLSRYPLRLQRNTYISSYFFSALVLVEAADTLIATISPSLYSRGVDLVTVAIGSVCFLTWACVLRREGEAPPKIRSGTPEDDELLRQLESLNRTLSRAARR